MCALARFAFGNTSSNGPTRLHHKQALHMHQPELYTTFCEMRNKIDPSMIPLSRRSFRAYARVIQECFFYSRKAPVLRQNNFLLTQTLGASSQAILQPWNVDCCIIWKADVKRDKDGAPRGARLAGLTRLHTAFSFEFEVT